jgi:uncharacterized protein (DUF433 family)
MKSRAERMIREPNLCAGESIFCGTRVTLRTVLRNWAAGGNAEEILADFPALAIEDFRAAIVFAAASAKEDLPVRSIPPIRRRLNWMRICATIWKTCSTS